MIAHPARNTDPLTSNLAASEVVASGLQAYQQRLAVAAVRAHPGHTSAELAQITGPDRYMLARRLPECIGYYVRACNQDAKRTCTVTGRKAMTWEPVL